MSTLTLLACLAGAALSGGVLGFAAACAYRDAHQPRDVARLTRANMGLAREVEEWRARTWRAEQRLLAFIGYRNIGSIITVDRWTNSDDR